MDTAVQLRKRIADLRETAEQLELNAAQRAEQLDAIVRYGETFIETLEDQPAYMPDKGTRAGAEKLLFEEAPGDMDSALALLREHVDTSGAHIGSSRFLAYIPSGGLYTSALGDFLASVTNRYAGVQFSAPGVARFERMLVRWLADIVDYPPTAAGDLTSGGSIAGLSAVVAGSRSTCHQKRRCPTHRGLFDELDASLGRQSNRYSGTWRMYFSHRRAGCRSSHGRGRAPSANRSG